MIFRIIGTAIGLGIMTKVAGSACHTLDRSCQPQRRYNYKPHYNNRINNYTCHQNNNYNHPQKKKRNDYWKLKVI